MFFLTSVAALTCINFGHMYKGLSEGRRILLFMMIKINWQWMQSSVYFGPSCKISSRIMFWVQGGKRPCSPQAARVGYWKAESNKQNMGNSMKCSSFDSSILIKLYVSGCSMKFKGTFAINFNGRPKWQTARHHLISITQPAFYRSMYDSGILCFCSKWLNFSTLLSTAFN